MSQRIGMCDSGIGGLLVANALFQANPHLDIVYIGDQKNAPYGEKTREQLLSYAIALMNQFVEFNISTVIIACGTLCANVLKEIQDLYPNMNIMGILEPTCTQLKGKKVTSTLVLATQATVQRHAYQTCLNKMDSAMKVIEVACPKLVPLIEGGGEDELLQATAIEYVYPYVGKVDAVIMGCTHFPLVEKSVGELLNVPTFNSNVGIVTAYKSVDDQHCGKIDVYTSKDAKTMKEQIKRLIHKDWEVQEINLDS